MESFSCSLRGRVPFFIHQFGYLEPSICKLVGGTGNLHPYPTEHGKFSLYYSSDPLNIVMQCVVEVTKVVEGVFSMLIKGRMILFFIHHIGWHNLPSIRKAVGGTGNPHLHRNEHRELFCEENFCRRWCRNICLSWHFNRQMLWTGIIYIMQFPRCQQNYWSLLWFSPFCEICRSCLSYFANTGQDRIFSHCLSSEHLLKSF